MTFHPPGDVSVGNMPTLAPARGLLAYLLVDRGHVRGSFSLSFFSALLGLRCCVQVFSSCCEPGLLFVGVHRLHVAVTSFVAKHKFWVQRLQSLQHLGLAAPRHVESSGIKVETHVPCVDRWILNHWAQPGKSFLLFLNASQPRVLNPSWLSW